MSDGPGQEQLSDLHRHLDGSIRRSTLDELAAAKGKRVPSNLLFRPGMGLGEALSRFGFILSLMQEPAVVRRVAAEACEDAAREGVTTLELRFAPQLHRGAAPEEVIDAALDGIAGRAGLVLCGLYGEPPSVLQGHVDAARTRKGVVGIDLAGGPDAAQRWIMEDYAPAFRAALEHGIGRTVHAGEGRQPNEIRIAIEVLSAQRIGHGTTLADDDGVTALVVERGVTIEACPTSNWHTGAVKAVKDHPLPIWLRDGVKACLCTDNTLLSGTDARSELERAAEIRGMTGELLRRAVENGHQAAFRRS